MKWVDLGYKLFNRFMIMSRWWIYRTHMIIQNYDIVEYKIIKII